MASAGGCQDDTDSRAAIVERVRSPDEACRIDAAREIRRLTKTSSKNRRHLAPAIEPLVAMLKAPGNSAAAQEAALLALLNLAVQDERNKINIMDAGALSPVTAFLQSPNATLQECATAAVLTLSACAANKPALSAAGIIPILLTILCDGTHQAALDAVTALHNLSTLPGNLAAILHLRPVPPLVSLLKRCSKASKPAEKCSALLEALLLRSDDARVALTAEEGGVLAVVEVLEEGTPQGRQHAVGMLLAMCESDRRRYREAILKEGCIPGLLELTVQGTPKAQVDARRLLHLLRESPYSRPIPEDDALETIVCGLVSRIGAAATDDRGEKARKMLAEMVQVSMEQSLRHLQQRAALVCSTPAAPDHRPVALSAANCPSAAGVTLDS